MQNIDNTQALTWPLYRLKLKRNDKLFNLNHLTVYELCALPVTRCYRLSVGQSSIGIFRRLCVCSIVTKSCENYTEKADKFVFESQLQ